MVSCTKLEPPGVVPAPKLRRVHNLLVLEIMDSPQDGAYGPGVWLQMGAKFGLVGLVGLLRVS